MKLVHQEHTKSREVAQNQFFELLNATPEDR